MVTRFGASDGTLCIMEQELKHISVLASNPVRYRYSKVLGENVKRLRKQARINKKQFALMVEIGRPFLNKIEAGEANPRVDVVTRMADALEVEPSELLTEFVPETPAQKPELRASQARHSRLY